MGTDKDMGTDKCMITNKTGEDMARNEDNIKTDMSMRTDRNMGIDMSMRTDKDMKTNKTGEDMARKGERMTTEERILREAERIFLEKGYGGARTTEIAEAAGVTHAMLHYYFRTKDNLFDKVIEGKIGAVKDIMLGSLTDSSIPLFEKLKSIIETHQRFIAKNPELPRFIINEIFSKPDKFNEVINVVKRNTPAAISLLQRQIDEYAEKGLCRRIDARMLILDIVSLNIFPIAAMPMVNVLLGDNAESSEEFIERRIKENTETIMSKLRP